MMDVQRRDGRTAISCNEIATVKGFILSQDSKTLTIKTIDDKIIVEKGSFKYDEINNDERFYVLARSGSKYKLIDYL